MHDSPRPRRRVLARRIAGLLAVAIASVVVWRWVWPPREPILEAGWTAVAAVLAGDGVAGMRDDHTSRARFSDPFGVVAGPNDAVYVADAGDAQRIRRIGADGRVSTLAGGVRGYADGPAISARFDTPSGLALDPHGVLYVADTGNNAIRRLSPEGIVSTAAGTIVAGYRDGAGAEAMFNGPVGVAVDAAGRVIVADTYNDRIRAIEPDGRVITLAGSGEPGPTDGPAAEARFDTPCGVAVDAAGNVYVADTGNGGVRLVSPEGFVSTIGPLPPGGLLRPIGIGVDSRGVVYVTDDRGRIVEITPGVAARTLAGSRAGFADGAGGDARFRSLAGLALAGPGRLIVADPRNALVRMVTAQPLVQLRPPVPPGVDPRFDAGGFARRPLLWPVAPLEGPFEITGTLGEPRGGDGAERFHSGLDIHAAQGVFVRAVREGLVEHPAATGAFGTLNEWVRMGSLTYVHLRVGRQMRDDLLDRERFVPTYDEAGRLVHIRVKRGARFRTGEPIGTVNAFNHVHVNVGWPGEEHNPLDFRLLQFEDTVPPTIARGGVRLFGEDGQPITARQKGRLVVEGRIQVVVDAWDQVDGNRPWRRLGLYRLGYQILHRDGSPAPGFETPRETIRFDRLPVGPDAARLIYASGSGIPFYGGRTTRFLYVVTNTLQDGVAAPGIWDSSTLPPGDYTLRILAADIRGNEAVANRDVPVTIAPQTAEE